ncbi:PAS domain S-box-containing protein [Azospirillum picis]|uniref:histidine kinase n=1 Tax=Azospirillum picis TaxID=488438 RepID=A0ABU0MQB1_9PROT|nr:PAS domain-containing protein [Azospirillum picis]MBP2302047.1 PAS domain S-box-containing protein [Azospirillum picis]MDQ0535662.1 PAS domain S-box-containing protein [Azospirillum picis]
MLVFLLAVALPFLWFEIYSQLEFRQYREREIKDQGVRLLSLIEAEQQRIIEDIRHILVTLTEMGVGRMDAASCLASMAHLRSQYPPFLAVSISNASGVVWCTTEPAVIGLSVADREYRQQAIQTRNFTVSQLIESRTTKRPAIAFALGYGGGSDTASGVAAVLLDIGWLEEFLLRQPIPDYASVFLTDKAGTIVASVPPSGRAMGLPLLDLSAAKSPRQTVEGQGADGRPRIVVRSPADAGSHDLGLMVSLDKARAMRAVDLAALRTLSIFAGLLLLTAAGFFWGLRRFLHVRETAERNALKTAMVLASTVDGVVEFDRDWRFTYLNDKAKALIAQGRELVGQSLWEAFPELVGSPLWDKAQQAMSRRVPSEVEFQGMQTGRWFWMRAFPSADGLAVYLLDITRRRHAEDELRINKERLDLALESAGAGTFEWDLRSGRGLWSAESYRIFGLEAEAQEISTDTWAAIVHPDDLPAASLAHAQLLAERAPEVSLEYRVIHPGGQVRWVMSVGRVCYDEQGMPVRYNGLTIDITERKRMEEALRRTETRLNIALSAADAALWDVDLRTGAITWSDSNFRLFGLDRTSVRPSREAYLAQVHPADRARVEAHIDVIIRDDIPDPGIEYRIRRPEDGVRWILSIGRVERDAAGRATHFSGLNIDVTNRRAMQEALRSAKERAEEANVSKSKFLAAASHDLRQPLQSALLFAGVLHAHVDPKQGRSPLMALERALVTLKDLLDSLLDVSRLDAGVIVPRVQDMPLRLLFDEIAAAYSPVASAKGLEFRVDASCGATSVHSDPLLLGRMLRNLVENAIRYTERGFVRMDCDVTDGSVCIRIHDSGIGISAEHLSRIFEEFHQVGNPERDRSQGLGLGLAIVQRLSRLLGHPVAVRSEPGKGSTFSIEVPRAHSPEGVPEEPQPSVAGNDGSGRLAVLVDDDAIVLAGLRTLFHDWGYEVGVAGSIGQALEIVRAAGRSPDIVVADYRLRNHEVGTDVVREIRGMAGRRIPGIILTGEIGPEAEQAAAALGLVLAAKPVTPRQLQTLVESVLGGDGT